MSARVRTLRLLAGGPPCFAAPLHVGRPNVGNHAALLRRVGEMLERGWLTNDGPLNQEFERRIAEMVGVRHCVGMCNATVALEIAIRAAGLTGEVIIPSYTFVATAHALQWQGIRPVFADIDPTSQTLDPAAVEALITPQTTGILGVHLWGRPSHIEALEDIARRRGVTLLFDAAHAFGCSHAGRMIGGFGRAEVFSFHATKVVQSGEGGAVVTNDGALADKMRLMRNFGFAGYDNVVHVGTNGKLSELAAAMGLTSLESMPEFIATNGRNYEQYRAELAGLPGLKVLEFNAAEQNNYQYVVLEIDNSAAPLTRDQLLQVLHSENVLARRYFYPGVHRMEAYRTQAPAAERSLPATDRAAQRVLVLPTGTAVSAAAIQEIGEIIRLAFAAAADLRPRLPRELSVVQGARHEFIVAASA